MTELAEGNLLLDDFETLIGGASFDKIVQDKFIQQQSIEEYLNLILTANDFINDEGAINKEIGRPDWAEWRPAFPFQ